MSILWLLPLLLVLVMPLAFAETTYDIDISYGAADSGSSDYWFDTLTGDTTGEIVISSGDSVTWYNGDTAFHTITSVTASGEEDGVFDSGFFSAGESYTRQFTDVGDFDYYCSLHPWMTGAVIVISSGEEFIDLSEFDKLFEEESVVTTSSIIETVVENEIPSWVRGVFVFWANEQIDDSELIEAIKFLVNSGIIVLE